MPPAQPMLNQDGEQLSSGRSSAGSVKTQVGGRLSCRVESAACLRAGETVEQQQQKQGTNGQVPSERKLDNNALDRLKELEQARLESERDLCIFTGALGFLREQLSKVNRGHCPVCYRSCTSQDAVDHCRQQIEQKIEETEQAREKLNLVDIHNSCVRSLSEVRPPSYLDKSDSMPLSCMLELLAEKHPRVAFNIRNGALTELRNQKVECLISKTCFACGLSFSYTESVQFLSRIDHMASSMEKELHVHT